MTLQSHSLMVFFFTALPCEAKPLVEYYRLKKDTTISTFAIYRNNDICLTVTGIGKTSIAAGVAYCMALFKPEANPVMINIGIAGHKTETFGRLFLIDKITDTDTGKSFYPPLVFTPPCSTASLLTYSKQQNSYPETALCDMEASAFYETAVRFSYGELIQTLKIISDNAEHHTDKINAHMASELIKKQLPVIAVITEKLAVLTQTLTKNNFTNFDDIINQHHFTVSQQIQLKKLLSRWQVMTGNTKLELTETPVQNGSQFLLSLEDQLGKIEFSL